MRIFIKHLIIVCVLPTSLFFCRSALKVEGAVQRTEPKAIILIGNLENRDIRYIPHTPENVRDMLKFEFLKAGFDTDKMNLDDYTKKIAEEEKEENTVEDKIGDLPIKFRSNAGENFYPNRLQISKNLNSKQIIKLTKEFKFNYFVQGAVALHNTGKLLESKENNLFFLDIYNNKGKQVGMISFTIEEESLQEASLLKKLCTTVVTTFQDKIKESVQVVKP